MTRKRGGIQAISLRDEKALMAFLFSPRCAPWLRFFFFLIFWWPQLTHTHSTVNTITLVTASRSFHSAVMRSPVRRKMAKKRNKCNAGKHTLASAAAHQLPFFVRSKRLQSNRVKISSKCSDFFYLVSFANIEVDTKEHNSSRRKTVYSCKAYGPPACCCCCCF